MSTTITPTEQNIEINVNNDVIDINVTNEIVDVNATTQQIDINVAGAYPIPNPVLSVFGRTGVVVATEGDYTLTQLGDVTLSSPSNGQVLKYNGTAWVNGTDAGGITSIATTSPITGGTITTTGTIGITQATTSTDGFLSSTDWNTFNNKQDTITNPVTGTGTANTIPLWNASSNITNSVITQVSGNIRVGSTTQTSKLNVGGDIDLSGVLKNNGTQIINVGSGSLALGDGTGKLTTSDVIVNTTAFTVAIGSLFAPYAFTNFGSITGSSFIRSGGTSSQFLKADGSVDSTSYQPTLTNPITGTGTSGQVAYFNGTSSLTSESNLFWDATNDRLGIGTASPTTTLDVNGLTRIRSLASSFNNVLLVENTGSAAQANKNVATFIGARGNASNIDDNTNISIWQKDTTVNNYGVLSFFNALGNLSGFLGTEYVSHTANPTGHLIFGTVNAASVVIKAKLFNTGNFLIQNGGTFTDAGFRLDVNGTARVQGNMILNTMNLGIGTGSTTNQNMAFGFQAGSGANTGTGGNMFLGYQVGRVNTSGSYNVGLGYVTLFSNTTGIQNTAIGTDVLYFNTTGSNNTAIGTNAGTFISGGVSPATIVNNSIFIGYQAYPLASSQTNQIVIGYDVVGLGSNTTVLGNASTVTTAIYGDILIGTTTALASTKLTVSGSETASGAIARGGLINTTLVAAANNDVLVGLDINPTFTNGAFTGVTNAALRVTGAAAIPSLGLGSGAFFIAGTPSTYGLFFGTTGGGASWIQSTRTDGTAISYPIFLQPSGGTVAIGSSSTPLNILEVRGTITQNATITSTDTASFNTGVGGGISFAGFFNSNTVTVFSAIRGIKENSTNGDFAGALTFITRANGGVYTERGRYTSVGNFLINTTTDAGFRLDVNGTARVTSAFATDNITVGQGAGTTYKTIFTSVGANPAIIQSIATIGSGSAANNVMQFRCFDGFNAIGQLTISGDGTNVFEQSNTPTRFSSAMVAINSTTKGFLPPRMTTTQRTAISSPAAGLVVYDTTLNVMTYYNGTLWILF
jgi:hypothetical protein